MDSHIRVYIEANWNALGCLPPIAYKVLISLCQRADNLGRCFPSAERIADDCACNIDSVWPALKTLEENHFMCYLRRNEQDPVTGRWLPNVYMVNPHFICIALEFQEQALGLWQTVKNYEATLSEISATNQQQELSPRTSTNKPTKETNNNNQRTFEKGGLGDAPQNQKSPAAKKPKAKSEPQKSQADSDDSQNQQSEASQRSKKRGSSAAAYRNPDPIAAPIPDDVLERLANRVNGLGVPIPLARGFVVAYGGEICEAALLQLQATKSKGQEIKNEGGFFRHLLQNNLIDKSLPDILTRPKTRSSWADLAEVDYE